MFDKNRTPDFESGEIIIIDKEKGWSSFDVVRKIKFILKYNLGLNNIKVGHAGTLDPLATGLVIVCTGKATKTITDLQTTEKQYLATIQLGATTPSYDLETEIDNTYPIDGISEEKVLSATESFKGEILQTPPIFSAIWHDGKRAYKLARRGEKIELKKRTIFIRNFEVQNFFLPFFTSLITCSSGTYIRSLANDLGKRLDNGALLYYLRRIKNGKFTEKDALKIDEFEKIITNL